MTMLAFHNDPTIKAKYLARVRAHAAADELIKGRYWENGKGCAVGCTIHGSDHAAYETELGIPAQLAHLEDTLFENQANGAAKAWPERFLNAIPVGADLSQVWPEFGAWLMDDPTYGVMSLTDDAEIRDLAAEVAFRYRTGDTSGDGAIDLADRLWAARDARAAWAARDAWAAWAARDAWDAWEARAARDAFVKASADKLIELSEHPPAVASPIDVPSPSPRAEAV